MGNNVELLITVYCVLSLIPIWLGISLKPSVKRWLEITVDSSYVIKRAAAREFVVIALADSKNHLLPMSNSCRLTASFEIVTTYAAYIHAHHGIDVRYEGIAEDISTKITEVLEEMFQDYIME